MSEERHERRLTRVARIPRWTGVSFVGLLAALGMYLAPASTALQAGAPSTWTGNQAESILGYSIADPGTKAFGKTYGEWAGEWWQWALQFHLPENPIFDETGAFGDQGQHGKVWFLSHAFFSSNPVVRDCTVPAGKALFFPLYNVISWAPEFGNNIEEVRADANACIENPDPIITCTIDGEAVSDLYAYRAQSPPGGFELTSDALLTDVGFPPGPYEPAVSDGYWLMLIDLPPGLHTIHFQVVYPGFAMDVTYNLTLM